MKRYERGKSSEKNKQKWPYSMQDFGFVERTSFKFKRRARGRAEKEQEKKKNWSNKSVRKLTIPLQFYVDVCVCVMAVWH